MEKSKMQLLVRMRHALGRVADVSDFGDQSKYSPGSWLEWSTKEEALAWTEKRMGSLFRHAFQLETDGTGIDHESGVEHLAAVAWNALAILEIRLRYGESNI